MLPTSDKRRPLRVCATVITMLISFQLCADEGSEYQQSIDSIAKKITQISDKLNADKALLKTEQDKLSAAEQRVAEAQQQLVETNTRIESQSRSTQRVSEQIARLVDEQQQDRQAFEKLVRVRYMRGQPNYLKMLLNQENPYAVGRLGNYYRYFATAQQTRLSGLRAQLKKSQVLQQTRQQLLKEMEQQKQQQARLHRDLQLARQNRQKSIAKLRRNVNQSSDQLKKLQQDRARLNRLLEQIAAQAQALRRIEQKKAEEHQRQQQQASSATSKVIRPLVAGGFLQQRGRLQYPVSGTRKYNFGTRLVESGMQAQGAFFDTIESVPVESIFRGRVLFADYLKGYGLLMIVDHGDDHISLYGHNELLYKKVGDQVQTREVVAKSGVSGGLKTPGLYFEIRNRATPVDPAGWCR